MFPHTILDNHRYCPYGNTILSTQFGPKPKRAILCPSSANILDLLLIKFGLPMSFTSGGIFGFSVSSIFLAFRCVCASLNSFVSVIILISTKPKVSRINAGGIVASVKHKSAFWYWTMIKGIGQAMSQKFLSGNTDPSVSFFNPIASPYPTRRSHMWHNRPVLINFRPKSIFYGYPCCNDGTCSTSLTLHQMITTINTGPFLSWHFSLQIKIPLTLVRRYCLGNAESQRDLLKVYDYLAKKTNDRPCTTLPKRLHYNTFVLTLQ